MLNQPKELVKWRIHTINTSLSSWSQQSRDYLTEFVKNINERDVIYWVQGLCANREKWKVPCSWQNGPRDLIRQNARAQTSMITFSSRLQQAYVPRRYIVIFGMYAFWMPEIACPPCLKRPKGWLKLFVSSPNLLTENKTNSTFRTVVGNWSRRHCFRRSWKWNRWHVQSPSWMRILTTSLL